MSDRPAFGAHLVKTITDRELRQARAILAVIGVLALVSEWLWRMKIHQLGLDDAFVGKLRIASDIGLAVGATYLVCALLVFRKPVFATVTGLVLYSASIAIQAMVDPTTLYASVFAIGIRLAILLGLISAVNFARLYVRNQRARSELPSAKVVG
ncbi:MAG TPA: hypothetical protein VLX92_18065 [Kofleriaceae bacterium]|nr:hypothetical protein [Kofleriaceae bacterium]